MPAETCYLLGEHVGIADEFEDTFRFEANRVLKSGQYVSAESSQKLVKVHWVEELRRTR